MMVYLDSVIAGMSLQASKEPRRLPQALFASKLLFPQSLWWTEKLDRIPQSAKNDHRPLGLQRRLLRRCQ